MTDDAGIIDVIAEIFERRGAEAYLGEPVSMSEHMLQTAALAQAAGESEAVVAAALLHDIGHLVDDSGGYSPDDTIDHRHEAAGARLLAGHFPPLVVDSIRLHVAAKRYLCAVEPAYHAGLSPASQHSLALQGGPMDDAEIAAFRCEPFHEAAVRVRRWDDYGKVTGLTPQPFVAFCPLLVRVVRG